MNNTVNEIEVETGVWIKYDTSSYGGIDELGDLKWIPKLYYRCSRCRKGTVVQTPYCPYCGVKMGKDN